MNDRLNDIDDGSATPSREKLGAALHYMNERLSGWMADDEIGIEPDYIHAIGWLERQGFRALQALTYEDQVGLMHQEWFKNILKFQELTYSTDEFNEIDFNSFIDQLRACSSYKEAHKLLLERTGKRVSALSDQYKRSGHPERGEALWSGNITHEIFGLVDLREAHTAYGKRHRKESMTPIDQRNTGD